jgi:hypothetical protein
MRKLLVTLALTSLTAAASVVGALPAQAACTAPQLVSASVSPKTVTLGVSTITGVVLTAKYKNNGCAVSKVETDLFAPARYVDTLTMERLSTSGGVSTWEVGARINPGAFPNSDAGTWHTSIYATYGSANTNDDGATFKLVRAAALSTNATPEPVRKGRTITVKGTLSRANWDTARYDGYSGRTVRLQFRTAAGSYKTIKTVVSATGGQLKTTVRVTRDGCFRYVYGGNSVTSSVRSKADCVHVI